MRVAGLLVALLLTATACEDRADDTVSEPTPTVQTTETATEEPLPCVLVAQPFTGPAVDAFGPDRVMAAYCMLAELALEQATTSLALPIPDQEAKDLGEVRPILTSTAQQAWGRGVRAREPVTPQPVNASTDCPSTT